MALPLTGLGVMTNGYSSTFRAETTMFEFIDVFATDDDDPTLLPNLNLFAALFVDEFRRAYIEPKDANKELPIQTGSTYVPFELNNDTTDTIGFARGLHDEPAFWVQLLVAAYQPAAPLDCDPDDRRLGGRFYNSTPGLEAGNAVFAWTYDDSQLSVIYLETIRDCYSGGLDGLGTVVSHETGHGPGVQPIGSDHEENRLMSAGNQSESFNEISLERFRKTSRWYGPPVRPLVQPRRGPQ